MSLASQLITYTPGLVTVLIHLVLAVGVAAGALYVIGLGRLLRPLLYLAALAYVLTAFLTLVYTNRYDTLSIYGGAVLHDRFTAFMVLASALAALVVVSSSERAASRWPTAPGFHSLAPVIMYGSYILAGASEAGMVLAAWLLLSIASYVAIGLPGDRDSLAAAARYIYVGTIATLLVAIWVAALASKRGDTLWMAVALVAAAASLGFKVGVFPFHWWLPPVYGRAEGRAVALVAAVAKPAFIALLAKVVATASAPQALVLLAPLRVEPLIAANVLAVIAVASMTIGNVAALTTGGFQAMLAYSSLAQAGYILVGLAALAYSYHSGASPLIPLAGIALQTLAYSLAKAPLFALAAETGGRVRGALHGDPLAAASVAVLLASLLGVPFLIGFWGKLYLFLPAVGYSVLLVAIALINSGVSSAYYIRFLREAVSPGEARVSRDLRDALVSCAAATLILGLIAPLAVLYFT